MIKISLFELITLSGCLPWSDWKISAVFLLYFFLKQDFTVNKCVQESSVLDFVIYHQLIISFYRCSSWLLVNSIYPLCCLGFQMAVLSFCCRISNILDLIILRSQIEAEPCFFFLLEVFKDELSRYMVFKDMNFTHCYYSYSEESNINRRDLA